MIFNIGCKAMPKNSVDLLSSNILHGRVTIRIGSSERAICQTMLPSMLLTPGKN
jgi:hypothetical protein